MEIVMKDPTFKEAWSIEQETRRKRTDTEQRLAAIRGTLTDFDPTARRREAAESVLRGEPVDYAKATLARTEAAEKAQELAVLRDAEAMAKKRTGDARAAASMRIAEKAEPEYAKALQELADALRLAAEAHQKARDILARLEAGGVMTSANLRPFYWPELDLREGANSKLRHFLTEAREYHGVR